VRPRLSGPSLIFKWWRDFKRQYVLWATTGALPLRGAPHAWRQLEGVTTRAKSPFRKLLV
jgi:hypothetical protein